MNNRPKIKVSSNGSDRLIESMTIAIIIFHCAYLFLHYSNFPDQIPTHFNAAGKVDGTGGRSSILLLPVINVLIYLLLTVLSRFPHIHNYMVNITEENASFQYSNSIRLLRTLKLVISVVLTYISYTTIQVAFGNQKGLSPLFLVAFLITIFSVTGYFMYRMFKYARYNKA
jgi:uncharacterized membrane protein